ncbi:MAG: YceD family protein [Candidatus Limnocylindrales bacterium]
MLSYNVAGLLRSAPGTARRYAVHEAAFDIAEDLRLAAPIDGEVRLSHTGRSILARADLTTALDEHCARCLVAIAAPISVYLEEEALPSIDVETGQPVDASAEPDALRLDDHHELDLAQPVREAISLAEPIAPLCRPDCRGLCATCGVDLNESPDHDHGAAAVDPRLALLAEWRASGDGD